MFKNFFNTLKKMLLSDTFLVVMSLCELAYFTESYATMSVSEFMLNAFILLIAGGALTIRFLHLVALVSNTGDESCD